MGGRVVGQVALAGMLPSLDPIGFGTMGPRRYEWVVEGRRIRVVYDVGFGVELIAEFGIRVGRLRVLVLLED
jgi:hypothetical protein